MRNELRSSVGALVIRIILGTLALVASIGVAIGNPIAVHETELSLVGERVAITVGTSESKVSGEYRFHVKGYQGSPVHDFAQIDMPVILPVKGGTAKTTNDEATPFFGERWWLDVAMPTAAISQHDVHPWAARRSGQGFGLDDRRMAQLPLPEGWQLVFFRFEFSIKDKRELNVQISYSQPHLPGNISAYLPILPDDIVKKNYLITFQAQDGTRFSPAGSYEIVGRASDTNLSARPVNVQLLEVQVK